MGQRTANDILVGLALSLRITPSNAAGMGSEKPSRRSSSNPQRGGDWLSSTTSGSTATIFSGSVSTRIISRSGWSM